ncbi:MAG: hypothetical protein ACSHWZ_05310 [Sulfitobacter sp.]
MTDAQEATTSKTHYICQTYIEKKAARGQVSLQMDKQFQYTSAAQAQERAEREFRLENCVGADAYMIIEDPSSDEVGEPDFLVRLGAVPEA